MKQQARKHARTHTYTYTNKHTHAHTYFSSSIHLLNNTLTTITITQGKKGGRVGIIRSLILIYTHQTDTYYRDMSSIGDIGNREFIHA